MLLLVFGLVMFNFFFIWLRALAAGARVTFMELIALRLRSVPVGLIVDIKPVTRISTRSAMRSPSGTSLPAIFHRSRLPGRPTVKAGSRPITSWAGIALIVEAWGLLS